MKLNDGVTFKKILINGETYFLQCQQNSCHGDEVDDVMVRLTNGGDVFTGKLKQEDISKMSTLLDDNMQIEKLDDLLFRCLATQSSTNQFDYQLEPCDETTFKFVMKQVLEGGIKFQLGHLEMTKTKKPSTNILSFLENLTTQLCTLKKEVETLRKKNTSMENEQDAINKRLENYVTVKDTLEQDLYTKFSLVLNEKKAKIRELKQQAESNPKISRDKIQPINEDVDTDEEKERQSVTKRKYTEDNKDDNKQTTSTTTLDNVRLDDTIEDDDDLPQRSRKRIRASKPKTPTSSLMPRTTSLPRPKSSSSTSSQNRSSRRQSSREVDADDLLDEL